MNRHQGIALVDTSVAIALLIEDHNEHEHVSAALDGINLGLSGHAAFETFSVLTRLPPPLRRDSAVATTMIETNFPISRFLSAAGAATLLSRLSDLGISGGSVYDALVAAAAVEADATLFTRDERALDTYRSLEVRTHLLR